MSEILDKTLNVVEIFYSIQGEGHRTGTPSIFIRLAECNLNCWFCDTNFDISNSKPMTIRELKQFCDDLPCNEIVWTGGEPTMHLTNEIIAEFQFYYHCIETNGTNPIPEAIDYICVAPKEAPLHESLWSRGIDEIRIPMLSIQEMPNIDDFPPAKEHFVSPVFLGKKKERFEMDEQNVLACIRFVKENPDWRLSLQIHKIINQR